MTTLRTKVEPINRDIDFMIEEMSPEAARKLFIQYAKETITETDKHNETILGRLPRRTISIDGSSSDVSAARVDSTIIVEYELINDLLSWIADQLIRHSPVKSGAYQRSHTLFADGVETRIGEEIPAAEEYVFLSAMPYARKIEHGQSSQAPNGVYEVVSVLANRRFSNIAKIKFSYRAPFAGALLEGREGNDVDLRFPAIIVTMRT